DKLRYQARDPGGKAGHHLARVNRHVPSPPGGLVSKIEEASTTRVTRVFERMVTCEGRPMTKPYLVQVEGRKSVRELPPGRVRAGRRADGHGRGCGLSRRRGDCLRLLAPGQQPPCFGVYGSCSGTMASSSPACTGLPSCSSHAA